MSYEYYCPRCKWMNNGVSHNLNLLQKLTCLPWQKARGKANVMLLLESRRLVYLFNSGVLQGILFIFLTQRGDSRNVVAYCVTSGKFLLMLLFQQVIYLFWYLFYMFVSQTFFFLLIIMFFRCVPLTSASRTHI